MDLPGRLGKNARALISDPTNAIFVSAASCWEAAIKHALRKLRLSRPPDVCFRESVQVLKFRPLPIEPEHALRVGTLPPVHRDPFDRLLVAQAEIEGFDVVTSDPKFAAYGVKVIPAAR